MFIDNQASIKLMLNNSSTKKHDRTTLHILQEAVNDKRIIPVYIPSDQNVSDMFTKANAVHEQRTYIKNQRKLLERNKIPWSHQKDCQRQLYQGKHGSWCSKCRKACGTGVSNITKLEMGRKTSPTQIEKNLPLKTYIKINKQIHFAQTKAIRARTKSRGVLTLFRVLPIIDHSLVPRLWSPLLFILLTTYTIYSPVVLTTASLEI